MSEPIGNIPPKKNEPKGRTDEDLGQTEELDEDITVPPILVGVDEQGHLDPSDRITEDETEELTLNMESLLISGLENQEFLTTTDKEIIREIDEAISLYATQSINSVFDTSKDLGGQTMVNIIRGAEMREQRVKDKGGILSPSETFNPDFVIGYLNANKPAIISDMRQKIDLNLQYIRDDYPEKYREILQYGAIWPWERMIDKLSSRFTEDVETATKWKVKPDFIMSLKNIFEECGEKLLGIIQKENKQLGK